MGLVDFLGFVGSLLLKNRIHESFQDVPKMTTVTDTRIRAIRVRAIRVRAIRVRAIRVRAIRVRAIRMIHGGRGLQ